MKKTYKITDLLFDKTFWGYLDDVMDYGQETCDKVLKEFLDNFTVTVEADPADTLEERIDNEVSSQFLYRIISYKYHEI